MISVWAGEGRCRVLGQELTDEVEKLHGGLGSAPAVHELSEWAKFGVSKPSKGGDLSKSAVDTRWVATSKTVEGEKDVTPHVLAQWYQDPDLKDAFVETPWRVSVRPSRPLVVSLGAPKNGIVGAWALRTPPRMLAALAVRNFFVYPRPKGAHRISESRAPV